MRLEHALRLRALAACCAASAVIHLSGCASVERAVEPGLATPAALEERTAVERLRSAERFALTGRFSARHDGQQLAGQFSYRTDGANTVAEVFSPLGTVLARLTVDARGATLALTDGTVRNDASVASLIEQFTRLKVRDEALTHWLRGLPEAPSELGLADRFVEHGWAVEVLSRHEDGSAAPRRMRWQPEGSPDSEILWVLDRWVFD
ncbi:MAG: lipoprotein insertase outer membrane protein LolB [Casimicrobiaceae bacterium]